MSDTEKVLTQELALRLLLGRNLQKARQSARAGEGFKQQEVADRYGVTKGTVSAWETGRGDPGAVRLRSLCRLYGVDMDSMFSDSPLSPAAMQLAHQFDSLDEKQQATVLALLKAYLSGEGLPKPPQENREEEDALARKVIARSSKPPPPARKHSNGKG